MRLQLISDVHTEFHADHGRSFIDGLDPAGVDVLVVAGDLTVHDYLADNLERLCARFPEVVYVTGNHEYYRAEPELLKDTLRDLETRLGHFRWLENKMVKIGEQRFLGCTLWFPYDEENDCYERLMNDFRAGRLPEPILPLSAPTGAARPAEPLALRPYPRGDGFPDRRLPVHLSSHGVSGSGDERGVFTTDALRKETTYSPRDAPAAVVSPTARLRERASQRRQGHTG